MNNRILALLVALTFVGGNVFAGAGHPAHKKTAAQKAAEEREAEVAANNAKKGGFGKGKQQAAQAEAPNTGAMLNPGATRSQQ